MSAAPALRYVWATGPVDAASAQKLKPIESVESIESMAFYRKHTEALLRRYMRASMDIGRTPSIMGKEIFRGKVSSYRMNSFEDRIIFVFDVEKCLKRLDGFSRDLISRITLQEYTQAQAAILTGQSLRSTGRRYAEAIDTLTTIFLEYDLLKIDR